MAPAGPVSTIQAWLRSPAVNNQQELSPTTSMHHHEAVVPPKRKQQRGSPASQAHTTKKFCFNSIVAKGWLCQIIKQYGKEKQPVFLGCTHLQHRWHVSNPSHNPIYESQHQYIEALCPSNPFHASLIKLGISGKLPGSAHERKTVAVSM